MNIINWNLSHIFFHVAHMSFQASFIIFFVLILKKILGKRLPAQWHYGLWIIVFIRLLLPWSAESSVSLYNLIPELSVFGVDKNQWMFPGLQITGTKYMEFSTTAAASPLLLTTSFPLFTKLIPFVWIGFAGSLLTYVLVRSARFLVAIRNHRQVTREAALRLLEECKETLGVKTVLVIMETDLVKTPVLFGYIRPRLLLPENMIRNMSEKDLRHVFLHELGHLRHHDILVGWLSALVLALHWFNPLVWMSLCIMRREREFACDATTLSHLSPTERKHYGLMLLNLSARKEDSGTLPGITGIIELKSVIKRRIEMIAAYKKTSPRYSLFITLCFALFSFSALTSANMPGSIETVTLRSISESATILLAQEQYDHVARYFDTTMARVAPPEKLKVIWEGLLGQVGAFNEIQGTRSERFGEYDFIFVTCHFDKGPMDIKFVFNQESEISGMWFVPTPQKK